MNIITDQEGSPRVALCGSRDLKAVTIIQPFPVSDTNICLKKDHL